ncbi:ABC transporter substrate-binding protein [Arcobacter sp. s6]|uniref:ABC transporter substrate-binding protein n=1 Tax=Arcobacter sp. s6 TaxID=3230363 RepID=UPI00349FD857
MWLDQFEFAGFYAAKEKGFYKDVGLDVEIKKYNQNIDLTDTVLEGHADFGINSSSLIIDKINGKDIVLLGTIFQSSPLILISLKDSEINSLKDMLDKKIMLANNQKDFAIFRSMFKNQDIDSNYLTFIPHTFKIDDLIDKKADVMSAYSTNELFLLKEKGYITKIFNPKDYGFDFYDDLIFTSKEFANNNPKLVKDFYSASIKGFEYSFNNIEEIAKLIYEKYNPQNKSLDSLIYEANEMKKLIYDKDGKIGTITKDRMNLIINSYKIMGLIKNPTNLDDIIYKDHLDNSFSLNQKENSYLHNKKQLNICIDPDWMPFEKIENGKHIGMSAEYTRIIKEKINIPINLIQTKNWSETLNFSKEKVCDFIPLMVETQDRSKYLNFTSSYIKLPLVIAGNIDAAFVEDATQIKNKKIGLVKDYAFKELLENKYKNITFIEVKNIKDGLAQIQKGKIDGFLENLTTLGYTIQKDYIGQIKIIAKLDENVQGSIASRNDEPLLNDILEKALLSISEKQRQDIYNKWIYVNYQKEDNYVLFNKFSMAILLLIFILILIYRQYLLKKMNEELNEKIKIEMEKNEEKNRISIQQSRMASMGEMLENIAHQWRQPLSTISVCASGMEIKKEYGLLSDEEINDSLRHIKNATQYLSNTIEDFRNFFSKDKISSSLDIRNTLSKVFDLINATFAKSSITVIRDIKTITFTSFENELIQVLMNILINAKDALDNKDSEKLVIVKVKKLHGKIVITIRDNAGGIDETIIDKIFEPYFTTKHQFNGTGIGLYMSKLIVEKHLDGEISAKNSTFKFNNKEYKGALFQIILPIKES